MNALAASAPEADAPVALNGHPAGAKITPETPKPQLLRLGDVLRELRSDADAAHEARRTGIARGPISGIGGIDRELSGAFAPGVHIVHGNAGTGKTAFCLQIASSCTFPALFVSCEMSPVELLRRHTARVTRTYLGRLKSGEMRGEDAEALARKACEAAPLLAFADATRAPAPVAFLRDFGEIVRGESRHLLIVVDSLHSWSQGIAAGLPEYEALNASIADLQRLAAVLNCPVLVVCERNRESMKTGGLNAGAGTRKIEYGAESVIDLDRDKEEFEDGSGEVRVTFKLAKNRHGSAGRPVELRFNGALQTFREPRNDETTPGYIGGSSSGATSSTGSFRY